MLYVICYMLYVKSETLLSYNTKKYHPVLKQKKTFTVICIFYLLAAPIK